MRRERRSLTMEKRGNEVIERKKRGKGKEESLVLIRNSI